MKGNQMEKVRIGLKSTHAGHLPLVKDSKIVIEYVDKFTHNIIE